MPGRTAWSTVGMIFTPRTWMPLTFARRYRGDGRTSYNSPDDDTVIGAAAPGY
jgi:hypothetical protein